MSRRDLAWLKSVAHRHVLVTLPYAELVHYTGNMMGRDGRWFFEVTDGWSREVLADEIVDWQSALKKPAIEYAVEVWHRAGARSEDLGELADVINADWHGTAAGFATYGCGCSLCVEAGRQKLLDSEASVNRSADAA